MCPPSGFIPVNVCCGLFCMWRKLFCAGIITELRPIQFLSAAITIALIFSPEGYFAGWTDWVCRIPVWRFVAEDFCNGLGQSVCDFCHLGLLVQILQGKKDFG